MGKFSDELRRDYPDIAAIGAIVLSGAAGFADGITAVAAVQVTLATVLALFATRSQREAARAVRMLQETSDLVPASVARLSKLEPGFEELLKERKSDERAHDVLLNYAEQAAKEPIDERRRMLAHAAAGIVDVRLTIAEHSRVERVMRELDPDDVRWLAVIDQVATNIWKGAVAKSEAAVRAGIWSQSPSADALLAAGCIRVQYNVYPFSDGTGVPMLDVTPLGRHVLRASRTFIAAGSLPREPPGREHLASERSETEARAILATVSGLVDEAWRSRRLAGSARYDAPKCGRGPTEPPAANGGARLEFQLPPADAEAARMRLALPAIPDQPQHGEQTEAFTCSVLGGATNSTKSFRISGPHDVLRWLAEDIEATWM